MTPTEYYQRLLESDQILRDEQQANVMAYMDGIYHQLTEHAKKSLLEKLHRKKTPLAEGVYLWGDVGIGKTFLIDSFFYCLPFKEKLRIHFHKFMRMIQDQLAALQGQANALAKIAKKLALDNKVICFDELFVNDIGDAMILAGLFKALYENNICLIFTSNTEPDNLYLNGLQRDSFIPAIELIKKNSKVIHLSSTKDYRFRNFKEDNFYYTPLDNQSEQKLQAQFDLLAKHSPVTSNPLHILGRDIRVRKMANNVVWFDFLDICGVPRSQNDYIAITNLFDAIIVSDVLAIAPEQNDLARSFINMVDVFYDANKKLILSAEKPIEQLYLSGRMLFEFARTRSRLIEMQTITWQKRSDTVAKDLHRRGAN